MVKKILTTLLLILPGLTWAESSIAFGQPAQDSLADKRISIQVENKPLYTVFWKLIQIHDVAIGFEESTFDRDHRHYYFETNIALDRFREQAVSDKEFLGPIRGFDENLITVNFENAKLEDVMNSIVRQMKYYDWEIVDGVVNIFPIKGRDTRLEALLQKKVSVFAVGEGDVVGSIQAQLMLFLPEFRTYLVEHGLKARTDRPGSSFQDRVLPEGLGFSDLTFRELLNAITASKRGGWMLQIKADEDDPGQEVVEIFI